MDIIASGTYRILRALEQCSKLRKMIHLSSALVYGSVPVNTPSISENYSGLLNPINFTDAYTQAKRYSETLCISARHQTRIPIIIARPFSSLGPFQALDSPWALNNFLYAALHNQPIKILGDGETRRSYLYGSDFALLLLIMLASNTRTGEYNIGHSYGISLTDLANEIIRQIGHPLNILHNTAGSKVKSSCLVPDMSKVKNEFNFTPAFSLPEAIERTFSWYS